MLLISFSLSKLEISFKNLVQTYCQYSFFMQLQPNLQMFKNKDSFVYKSVMVQRCTLILKLINSSLSNGNFGGGKLTFRRVESKVVVPVRRSTELNKIVSLRKMYVYSRSGRAQGQHSTKHSQTSVNFYKLFGIQTTSQQLPTTANRVHRSCQLRKFKWAVSVNQM